MIHILIADPEKSTHHLFNDWASRQSKVKLWVASTSIEALDIVDKQPIDIAFIDLYLSPVHGLELLKILKKTLPEIDVIITSYEPMIQNYRACLHQGALDYLSKPLSLIQIEEVFKKRKTSPYKPHPFTEERPFSKPFALQQELNDTYIKFWGTRGSRPVSGPEYNRFGGNTSCLEIRAKDYLVIIDAGSGLSNLGDSLVHEPLKHPIELLLGHTHLDHMAGLPSFAPLHDPKFAITLRAPINFYKSTKELLSDMLTHAFFPVDLEEVQATLKFSELLTHTPLHIGQITLECHTTYHPGLALGFKIKLGPYTLGYVTDNEVLMGYTGDPKLITFDHPLLAPHLSFIEFFKDCDLFIHEAQYTPTTYPNKIGWGHSSIYNTALLIKYIKPKIWMITHHDPADTDEILQKKHEIIIEACHYLNIESEIKMAFDGLKVNF